MNQINDNENKGFSLVELIVVIAIMAVLTSVLAPSLLGYVEKSRMQKDDSAMGEVANSIKLALADQNVYDECLVYSFKGNYSCYADSTVKDSTTPSTANAFEDKDRDGTANNFNANDDWHYNDTVRMKDEEPYTPNGNMRGLTITFNATTGANSAEFKMASARINKMSADTKKCLAGKDDTTIAAKKKTDDNSVSVQTTLSEMTTKNGQKGQLYNKLRAQIGDSITLSSQTYRNSDYTVFIRMGSMGGNDAAAQDAVAVYGQWSGTNLPN